MHRTCDDRLASAAFRGRWDRSPRLTVENALQGCTILVVEDNAIVAMDLEMILQDAGADVIGPADSVSDALGLSGHDNIAAAILDLEIRGEMVFPVADVLRARSVPVLLATGHGTDLEIPADYRDLPRLAKPYDAAEVYSALDRLFDRTALAS